MAIREFDGELDAKPVAREFVGELDAPVPEAKEDSWGSVLGKSLENIPKRWGSAVGGAVQAAGDTLTIEGRRNELLDALNTMSMDISAEKDGLMQAGIHFTKKQSAKDRLNDAVHFNEVTPSIAEAIKAGDYVRARGMLMDKRNDAPGIESGLANQIGETVSDVGKTSYEHWEKSAKENAPAVEDHGAKWYANQIVEGGIGSFAPALAVSVATRNPTAGAAVMGGNVFGNSYGEAKAKGYDESTALNKALFDAFAETISEKIPLGILTQEGGKWGYRILKGGASEGIQEMVTEAMQMGYESGALGENVSPEEVFQRMVDAGIIGAASGGVTAGIIPAPKSAEEKKPEPAEASPVAEDNAPITLSELGKPATGPDPVSDVIKAANQDLNTPSVDPFAEQLAAQNAARQAEIDAAIPESTKPKFAVSPEMSRQTPQLMADTVPAPELGVKVDPYSVREANRDLAISANERALGDVTRPEGLDDARIVRLEHRQALEALANQSLPQTSSTAIDPQTDEILDAIAKAGGLNIAEAKAQGIDPDHFKDRPGFRNAFRVEGKSFDGMAETLSQYGYFGQEPYTANGLLDKVSNSLSGNPVYSVNADHGALRNLSSLRLVEGMSPQETQVAIRKAINGERLGVRQARAVQGALDTITDERRGNVDAAKQQLELARADRKAVRQGFAPLSVYEADDAIAGEIYEENAYPAEWDAETRTAYEWALEAAQLNPQAAKSVLRAWKDNQISQKEAVSYLLNIIAEAKNGQEHTGTVESSQRDTGESGESYQNRHPAEAQGRDTGAAPAAGSEVSGQAGVEVALGKANNQSREQQLADENERLKAEIERLKGQANEQAKPGSPVEAGAIDSDEQGKRHLQGDGAARSADGGRDAAGDVATVREGSQQTAVAGSQGRVEQREGPRKSPTNAGEAWREALARRVDRQTEKSPTYQKLSVKERRDIAREYLNAALAEQPLPIDPTSGLINGKEITDPARFVKGKIDGTMLEGIINAAIQHVRNGGTATFGIVDLGNLGGINHWAGQDGGDKAIADIAGILSTHAGENIDLARQGGDEFMGAQRDGNFAETMHKADGELQEYMRTTTPRMLNPSLEETVKADKSLSEQAIADVLRFLDTPLADLSGKPKYENGQASYPHGGTRMHIGASVTITADSSAQEAYQQALATLTATKNKNKAAKPDISPDTKPAEPAPEQPKAQDNSADETKAVAILDAAGITGKERLDALKNFRDGTYTLTDLEGAYPAKAGDQQAEKAPESNTSQETKPSQNAASGEVAAEMAGDDQETIKQSPANTEDSGAELTYNKRNRIARGLTWDDVAGQNEALRVKEVVKAKVYPKPDYEAMVSDGMQPVIAHIVKQAYDSLAAKPATGGHTPSDTHLKTYIVGVNRVMDGVMAWAKDADATGAWVESIAKRAGAYSGAARGMVTSITSLTERAPQSLLERIYPDGWRNHKDEIRLIGGNRAMGGLQPHMDEAIKAMKDIDKGWPGKLENWQRLGFKVAETAKAVEVKPSGVDDKYYTRANRRYMESYGSKAEAEAAVAKMKPWLLLDKRDKVLGQYDTQEEAAEAARGQTKREKKDNGIDERGWAVEQAEREGPAHRMEGENISSDQLREAFGFKGVNFGNWLKGDSPAKVKERQLHLNHAYDSFMDLADILDVPPKALSLNGMLGLAIGAQGSGSALAHFVPGVNEINLTRTAGAGALAHEWAHALDHYFATLGGLAREKSPWMTEHSNANPIKTRHELVDGKYVAKESPRFAPELRPEILQRFKEILKAMEKRPRTEAEIKLMAQNSITSAKKSVDGWLNSIKRDYFKGHEEQFDKLAEAVRNQGKVEAEEGMVAVSSSTYLYPSVAAIRQAYKENTGRTLPLDPIKGLQSNVSYLVHAVERKDSITEHVPQETSTDYLHESRKADNGKSKAYWSSPWEMFARAFDAFVVDTLAEKAQKNSYLAGIEAVPPKGEDRQKIDSAFKALIGEFQTKETDTGVALFSRQPRFYSQLQRAIEAAPDKVFGKAAQVKLWLQSNAAKLGIKQDELQWSGILDYLDMRKGEKVSREEVGAFLSENGVRVNDVVKGDKLLPANEVRKMIERGDRIDVFDQAHNRRVDYDELEYYGDDEMLAVVDDGGSGSRNTKFSNYVPPGGIEGSYREILVTLPGAKELSLPDGWTVEEANNSLGEHAWYVRNKKGEMVVGGAPSRKRAIEVALGLTPSQADKERGMYTSGHWDEPNILVHLRTDEVTGADSKRYLRVIEIQSDWGQKGKKEGFGNTEWRIKGDVLSFATREEADAYAQHVADVTGRDKREVYEAPMDGSVPPAPFVTDTRAWVSLGIKRALMHAINSGVDGVVFATGQQNADLYDLSKQVQSISYMKIGDKYRVTANQLNDGGAVDLGTNTEAELEDKVGKEVAKKIVNGEGVMSGDMTILRGLDLKVGGEGMRAFYDQIVPSVANEVLKKIGGGRIGNVRVDGVATYDQLVDAGKRSGRTQTELDAMPAKDRKSLIDSLLLGQPGFLITDAMRNKVQTEGLPLFKKSSGYGVSIPAESAQQWLNAITAKLPGSPKVNVIASMNDAPAEVRAEDQRQRSQGAVDADPEGFYYSRTGEVYIVLSGVVPRSGETSQQAVFRVFAHEVMGHAGLRGLFGKQLDPLLREVALKRRKDVLAKAREYGLDISNEHDRLTAAEEVLAEMAQTVPENSLVVRAIEAIRRALRDLFVKLPASVRESMGGKALAEWVNGMSDAEIIERFIVPARQYIERGGNQEIGGKEAMAFSRSGDTMEGMNDKPGSGDNLAESQPRQPESEEIAIRLFGSKAKRSGGNVILYHGSGNKIEGSLSLERAGSGTEGWGAYFAVSKKNAEVFGDKVIEFKFPLALSDQLLNWDIPLSKQSSFIRERLSHLAFDVSAAKDSDVTMAYKRWHDDYMRRKRNVFASTMDWENKLHDVAGWGGDSDVVRHEAQNNPLVARAVFGPQDPTGREIYEALSKRYAGRDRSASEYLLDLGVIGSSVRSGSDLYAVNRGSRNIIIWDQDTLNGNGASAWLGAESPNRSQRTQGAGEVRFSRAQPQAESIPDETKFQKQARLHQDKFNRFKVIEKWLADHGVKLSESASVYKAEERYHGRVATKTEDFREKTLKPLIKKIQKAGFTLEQVSEFLHAQHAEERNKQIASINPEMPDGGSGMATAEAKAILAKASPELKEVANEYRKITEQTRDMLLKAGILSDEQVNAWQAAYQHYVPLKGGDEVVAGGSGKGFLVKNKQKRAMGHGSRNEMILENIQRDHERAIMLVEKNRVGQHLLKLAVEANRPDMVTIDQPKKRAVLRNDKSYQVLYHGSVVEVFNSLEAARSFVGQESMKQGRNGKDFAITASNDPAVAYMASAMLEPNETQVYVDGHAVRVQFNDELLARAYNNLGTEQMNAIFRAGRQINGYLSRMYTGYSIDFIFTNAVRDWTSGLINMTGQEGALFAAKAAKNYPKAIALLAKYAATGEAPALVKQYRADGGTTGAAYLSDLERIGHEARAAYDQYAGLLENARNGKPVRGLALAGEKALGWLLKPIERLNMIFENGMRLSAYMTAIESGHSREKGASLAKNVTVNFNRKGEIGQQINALWLFHNASLQGSAAIYQALFKSPHKHQAQALAAGLIGLGYLLASTMGGGDDDEYEKLPEYVKERNITLKTADGWITIPIPYGYGWFVTLGRKLSEVESGKLDAGKAALQVAATLMGETTVFGNALHPEGPDSKDLLFLAPTVMQIVGAPVVNRTSLGRPVHPEAYNKQTPDSQLMYRGTIGGVWDSLASGMNEATGGDEVRKGWADVSPETLKYIWATLTGGTGRGVTDTINAANLKAQGADLDTREMPIVRRFVKDESVADSRARFWQYANEAKAAKGRYELARKNANPEIIKDVTAQEKHLIQLAKMADAYTKMVNAKRDAIDEIRNDESLPLAQRRELIKEIEAEEEALYDRYVEIHKQKAEEAKD